MSNQKGKRGKEKTKETRKQFLFSQKNSRRDIEIDADSLFTHLSGYWFSDLVGNQNGLLIIQLIQITAIYTRLPIAIRL